MSAPVAVVTGGTRGLGLALSRRLIERGFAVAALYRGDDVAARAAEDSSDGQLTAIRVDLATAEQVTAAADRLLDEMGAPAVLVNNAGINVDRPFLELTDKDWSQVLAVNLSAPFHLTRALVPAMLTGGGGVVVNVGATTGIRPRRNGANYCAAKAGLLQLTKCLALELAPDIRVNALIPGMTETDELVARFRLDDEEHRAAALVDVPQQRLASVDDIADAFEFLIDTRSRYMTGQKLIVDGGQFMW